MEGSHFEIMLWTSEYPLHFQRVVKKLHQTFYLLWIFANISNTWEDVWVYLRFLFESRFRFFRGAKVFIYFIFLLGDLFDVLLQQLLVVFYLSCSWTKIGTAIELLKSIVKLKGFLPFQALRVAFVVYLFCNINIPALKVSERGSLYK